MSEKFTAMEKADQLMIECQNLLHIASFVDADVVDANRIPYEILRECIQDYAKIDARIQVPVSYDEALKSDV